MRVLVSDTPVLVDLERGDAAGGQLPPAVQGYRTLPALRARDERP